MEKKLTQSTAGHAPEHRPVPQDAAAVFLDVMSHRVKLSAKARISGKTPFDVLAEILRAVPQPALHK